uniref:Uncharacterized protein n=1 Tax=Opuntia streptacantha TaxID=393608 RepID=A0A7C9B0L5_OPUST
MATTGFKSSVAYKLCPQTTSSCMINFLKKNAKEIFGYATAGRNIDMKSCFLVKFFLLISSLMISNASLRENECPPQEPKNIFISRFPQIHCDLLVPFPTLVVCPTL